MKLSEQCLAHLAAPALADRDITEEDLLYSPLYNSRLFGDPEGMLVCRPLSFFHLLELYNLTHAQRDAGSGLTVLEFWCRERGVFEKFLRLPLTPSAFVSAFFRLAQVLIGQHGFCFAVFRIGASCIRSDLFISRCDTASLRICALRLCRFIFCLFRLATPVILTTVRHSGFSAISVFFSFAVLFLLLGPCAPGSFFILCVFIAATPRSYLLLSVIQGFW